MMGNLTHAEKLKLEKKAKNGWNHKIVYGLGLELRIFNLTHQKRSEANHPQFFNSNFGLFFKFQFFGVRQVPHHYRPPFCVLNLCNYTNVKVFDIVIMI